MNTSLSTLTRQLIDDLEDDIKKLKYKGSNMEVVWELEKIHKAFLKSAELIRKELNK